MENQTFEDEGILEGADAEELDFDASYDEDTDTSEEDGDTSSETPDVISKLKEITGREFKDEADFKKHYKHLSSYVGKKVEAKTAKPIDDERVNELEFKVDHPEFKNHFDIIKMVAKERGVSYSDAISDPLVKELVDGRQSKKGESIIHSNNKISSDKPALAKLRQNVNTEDGLTEYLQATLEK